MRLRNPGAIDQALQTIRTPQIRQGNTRSLHDGEARRDVLLNWCEDQARPHLELVFDPTEELLDELESAYYRLVLEPPTSVRRLNGMLNREYTVWDQRLPVRWFWKFRAWSAGAARTRGGPVGQLNGINKLMTRIHDA
jgi:hypothetical protein